jgi:AraC-like DNA-binding protein
MRQKTKPPVRARAPALAAGPTLTSSGSASVSSIPPEMPGTLRVSLVSHVPALLDMLGCDSAVVLRRAGIPRKLLANADNKVGYYTVGRLIDESIRATGLSHFGILAGEHFSPAVALGDVIDLMHNSPTIEAALRAFVLHHHLYDSGAVPMLIPVSARRFALAYSMFGHDVPAAEAFCDAAVAYGMQIMRMLCGKSWRPLQVKLARRRPLDVAPYTRAFGSHIRFDSSVSAIEFSSDYLVKPVRGADPERHALLLEQMQQRLLRDRISLTDQVKRALRPMLLSGTASGPNVASLFSMHERVLRGRLAAEGTTIRLLVRVAKLEIAAQLLRSTQLTVSEVGAAVGYSDPPSFIRAFRTHFSGVTPGEWRVQAV